MQMSAKCLQLLLSPLQGWECGTSHAFWKREILELKMSILEAFSGIVSYFCNYTFQDLIFSFIFFFVFSTYHSNGVGLLQDLVNVEYQLM